MEVEMNLLNVAVFAENLRSDLFATTPPLIKSRRQLFRSYPNTFVGSEIVTWILNKYQNCESHHGTDEDNNENQKKAEHLQEPAVILSSNSVTQALQKLVDFGIVHSVHGEIPFKPDNSLYRFTCDDGTCVGGVEAFIKGVRLYESMLCPNCPLLQRVCEYGELISDRCMRGSDLVTWVIKHGLASHREDGKRLCQHMFLHSIIKPATTKITEFEDGRSFYIFGLDFSSPPMSMREFVYQTQGTGVEEQSPSQPSDNAVSHVRQLSGQLLDLSVNEGRSGRRRNTSSSSGGSDDSGFNDHAGSSPSSSNVSPTFSSLLTTDGKLTPEALMHPEAPFLKKEMRIYPDAVGYGFIIRGSSPCFIKIVDPESPAGKCGLKAGPYITEINNRDVTRKSHTEIEDLILNGPKCLIMMVMLPKQDAAGCMHHNPLSNARKFSQPAETKTIPHTQSDPMLRRQSVPANRTMNFPSAQPWMKPQRKASDFGILSNNARFIH